MPTPVELLPLPSSSAGGSAGTSPSSFTLMWSRPASSEAEIRTVTADRERATPYLTAFSTTGWSSSTGTRALRSASGTSTSTRSRSGKRICSMSR